ncbi:MAG: ATP synthase F1 subunit delta [Treponema sp.]|jgi:F-type H+-transporting ATPase subunit delta|nr:ATP synthase F1 subunit delta [Treponema sp.]
MFTPGRWAKAYTDSLGGKTKEGLEVLKILEGCIKKIKGEVFGSFQAEKLEAFILHAGSEAGIPKTDRALTVSARLAALLIKKNYFYHIDSIIAEVEKILDRENGIFRVKAESAFPLEEEVEKKIAGAVKKRLGAKEIRLEKELNPALIGGYRLHIGDEVIDASVRLQLKNMAAELAAAEADRE